MTFDLAATEPLPGTVHLPARRSTAVGSRGGRALGRPRSWGATGGHVITLPTMPPTEPDRADEDPLTAA